MMLGTEFAQTPMRPLRAAALALVAFVALAPRPAAQGLPFALFDRYLDALRQESGIPGLSVAIVQGRRIVWDTGLGRQDVENAIAARADTPYLIGDLTQNFAAIVLGQCVEQTGLNINQTIRRWTTGIPESSATVRHVLAHTSEGTPGEAYRYDPGRFATLTSVTDACATRPFRRVVAEDIFDRLGMRDSLPGRDLTAIGSTAPEFFDDGRLRAYESVLTRLAVPYRVDRSGRASRADYPADTVTAAGGLISTVRDLARFDIAVDENSLIGGDLRAVAWTNVTTSAGTPLPPGLGWFVQTYNGERLVWQFGAVRDAGSALLLKVPSRDITLILLANSDGLAGGDSLAQGDVTVSLFARLFLRLFVS